MNRRHVGLLDRNQWHGPTSRRPDHRGQGNLPPGPVTSGDPGKKPKKDKKTKEVKIK